MRLYIVFLVFVFMAGCSTPPMKISQPGEAAPGHVFGREAAGYSREKQEALDIGVARQKVAADPTNWRCLNELGLLYSKAKLYGEAIVAFEQALALHPITTDIESERRQQAAIDAQHNAMLQQKKVQQDAQNSAAMSQLISGFIGSMASMPGIDPNAAAMLPALNASLSVASQTDMSLIVTPKQELESQIKPKLEVADIYFNLGIAQFENGNYAESILSLESSFSLNPSRSEILRYESEACFFQGSYQKSIALMNRYFAIGNTVSDPAIFIRVADAFRALGLDGEADKALSAGLDEYRRRIAADPKNFACIRNLAHAYIGQDLYEEAGKCFETMLKLDDSDDIRLELTTVQFCNMQLDEALQNATVVVNGLGADSPYVWYIVGRIHDERENASEALNAYRKASVLLERLPDGGRNVSYAGIIRAATGQADKALKELETGVADDPRGVDAHMKLYRLGICYEKTGNDINAIEVLNRALLLRPRYQLIRSALARLEKRNAARCDKFVSAAESAAARKDMETAVNAFTSAYQLMAAGPRKQRTLERILKLAAQMEKPLPMTSDAQRYYLRGNAALKSAKTPRDLDRAIFEYKWSSMHSPWASPVYLNGSVAYGIRLRYGEAMDSLKMFLTVNPNAQNGDEALAKLAELEYEQEASLRSLSFQRVVR